MPVAAQAALGKGGELARQSDRFGECISGLAQLVGQAHAEGLFAGHTAPGQDQVHGVTLADQPRQTHGAAIHQRHAPAPAVHAEDRVACRHPQIAPERELQAAGNGVTLHGGDHRLAEPQPGRAHGTIAGAFHPIAAARGHGLQVGAGAEGAARAGEDRHGAVRVGVEVAEGVCQRRCGRAVHRVADRRAVQGDDANRRFLALPDRHASLLSRGDEPCILGAGTAQGE